ncbi:hypothetical protein M2133_000953 [Parabacteroides sp. PF5-6]|nr:hypothetical protein [Parabacteroides sp. PF5-6]
MQVKKRKTLFGGDWGRLHSFVSSILKREGSLFCWVGKIMYFC